MSHIEQYPMLQECLSSQRNAAGIGTLREIHNPLFREAIGAWVDLGGSTGPPGSGLVVGWWWVMVGYGGLWWVGPQDFSDSKALCQMGG